MPTPENIGQNKVCKICESDRDTTNHVTSCIFIKSQVPESLMLDDDTFNSIYSKDLPKIIEFLNIFEKMWRKREEIIEKLSADASDELWVEKNDQEWRISLLRPGAPG